MQSNSVRDASDFHLPFMAVLASAARSAAERELQIVQVFGGAK
jgi:hypothetical protein